MVVLGLFCLILGRTNRLFILNNELKSQAPAKETQMFLFEKIPAGLARSNLFVSFLENSAHPFLDSNVYVAI